MDGKSAHRSGDHLALFPGAGFADVEFRFLSIDYLGKMQGCRLFAAFLANHENVLPFLMDSTKQ
ncbi:hypothetical protein D3C87_2029350 [compost metagenome]